MNEIRRHGMGPVGCSDCTIDRLIGEIKTRLAATPRPGLTINFINAHLYNLCWEDASLRRLINDSAVIAADGMAIVWAARLFGFTIPARCNMTDAFRAYLADRTAPATTAILVGGNQAEAERAAEAIMRDGPHLRIVKAVSGFSSIAEYEATLRGLPQPDFVLAGMGSPKSETFIEAIHRIWPATILWHIGGGTIMFYAGSLVEAPAWMRRCGLQWLHRLLIEPRRMWRRYILGNPLFLARILRAALGRTRS